MIVCAIAPLIFGNALHGLLSFACFDGVAPYRCSWSVHSPCHSGGGHEGEHQGDASPDHDCPICDFLSMPRITVCDAAWDFHCDLIEHREPEAARLFVVLYRSFEPGRAPPVVL